MSKPVALNIASVKHIGAAIASYSRQRNFSIALHYGESNSLHKLGEPDDIAKTVLFIISDAHYLNGQITTIDSGRNFTIYLR